ncbi:TetR/AcrR family transcriptional regulator [Streptomyces sp. A7024]|uniref:TetR/AcrR family transcriptional regulator n=1 Tax=Streptomyces coryli TaxID=1128680 RepID=A0A6G4U9P9_9ACTN|nr:TetR/AcrR family transcriptional regulator [Streptomyces coryli]NGN68108.1 TetR/AcrR family transcriptional regulator [Streptomyces coryli]
MSKREDRAPAAARPLRRDAELNRRRILRAGREVFAERGLQATLNDVAHHAGLGVGTVYRKFPDKQALAEAVFVEELDEIAGMARAGLDEGDAFAALARFLEDALARAAHNRGLREVMRRGGMDGDGLARARQEIERHCTDLVAKARAQGTLRAGITEADIAPIAAMIDAVMTLPGDRPPGLWRRYLEIILYGIHAGTPPPPAEGDA